MLDPRRVSRCGGRKKQRESRVFSYPNENQGQIPLPISELVVCPTSAAEPVWSPGRTSLLLSSKIGASWKGRLCQSSVCTMPRNVLDVLPSRIRKTGPCLSSSREPRQRKDDRLIPTEKPWIGVAGGACDRVSGGDGSRGARWRFLLLERILVMFPFLYSPLRRGSVSLMLRCRWNGADGVQCTFARRKRERLSVRVILRVGVAGRAAEVVPTPGRSGSVKAGEIVAERGTRVETSASHR